MLPTRWKAVLFRASARRLDAEIEEEMRFHLEMETAALEATGVSADEAHRVAHSSFGGVSRYHEEARRNWPLAWLRDAITDVRYGWRSLMRSPSFTIVAVLALGVGIGANATAFGAVDSLTFRSLAVPHADRLVAFYGRQGDATMLPLSYPDFEAVRREARSLTDVAAFTEQVVGITQSDGATVQWASHVSENYFAMLRPTIEIGRFITAADRDHAVVMISHDYWRTQFRGDTNAVGRTLQVNGTAFTVIGVIAPSFAGTRLFTYAPALWFPISMHRVTIPGSDGLLTARSRARFHCLGRLAPGATASTANQELDRIGAQLARDYPQQLDGLGFDVFSNRTAINPWLVSASMLRYIGILTLVGVSLVLLIACANVANLSLARMIARRAEFGIRLSLGASRSRLARQLVTESLLLAFIGALVAVLLSIVTLRASSALTPPLDFATSFKPGVDARVLVFTALMAIGAALVFGVAPIAHALRFDRQSRNTHSVPGNRHRMRSLLVVMQVALSFVVLVMAGLFSKGLKAARTLDLGFQVDHALVLTLDPVVTSGYDSLRTRNLYRTLVRTLETTTGVAGVTRASSIPLDGNSVPIRTFTPDVAGNPGRVADVFVVDDNYFAQMQMPVREGRTFEPADSAGVERVLVNQVLAQRHWMGKSAVGRRMRLGNADGPVVEVIGVVSSSVSRSLADPPRPLMWRALRRWPRSRVAVVIRTTSDPQGVMPAVRSVVRDHDPLLPIVGLRPLRQHIAVSYSAAESAAAGSVGFGLLAALLAATGIFGVISFIVSSRRREIGIRMALGARRSQVMQLVLSGAMRPVAIGVGIGIAICYTLPRSMSAILHGTSPHDPFVLGATAVILFLIAVTANALPVRKALRIPPVEALKLT